MGKLAFFFAAILFAGCICSIPANGQISSPQAIVPDFQVNENTGIASANQREPAIATNKDGRTVLVWADWRLRHGEIYAQLFSNSGTLIGNNIQLTNHNVSALIMELAVSIDSLGNFVVTWYESGGGDNIYAQRFANDGTPLGNQFQVNLGGYECHYPDITFSRNGNFIITWETMLDNGLNIFAQMFDSNGIPIGINFKVNDDTTGSAQYHASISSDSHGNFIIVWRGFLGGIKGIYAQRYTSNGTPIGTNFQANHNSVGLPYNYSDVAFGGTDNFTVIWKVTSPANLYGRRFSNDGIPTGNIFKINEDSLHLSSTSRPAISSDDFGNFIVTWDHFTSGTTDYDIYGQRYASDGTPIGNNFKVNDDSGNRPQSRPAVSTAGTGDFTIAWEDRRIWDSDIYAQQYVSDGTPIGNNFEVNDDTLSNADQGYPSMVVDNNGDFIITWHDYRDGRSDIYAQRISNSGTPIDTNFRVSADTLQNDQNFPDIASDDNDNFVIAWIGGYDKIYAQRFSSDGMPLGNNFKVNDASGQIIFQPSALSIAIDSSGDFVICWEERRNFSNLKIYAQRYSYDGIPLGSNFVVNDDTVNANHFAPDVSMDENGNFIVTWINSSGDYDIYAQRFSQDGNPIGNNFKVNEDSTNMDHFFPSTETNTAGEFIVSWYLGNISNKNLNVYGQRYSANGVKIGNSFRISENKISIDSDMRGPAISFDENGNFVITWEDYFNNKIYAQRYANDGTPIGNNFHITGEDSSLQRAPDVVLWNNRIYNTWEDNREILTGYDVWANVLDFDNPVGISDDAPRSITKAFVLNQNYPNPFNPSTTISYELPERSYVEIFVYNIAGQKIKTLINKEQQAGSYKIQWDGNNDQGIPVASGIYLYRLKKEGLVKTRKMILIR